MPPKRQNIGRRTNEAKRKRGERQNETEEETAQRHEGNRLHMSQPHATESSQQHEAQNEASRYANCDKDIMISKLFRIDESIEGKLSGANLSNDEEVIPLFSKDAMNFIENL
ncbi:hypothetical protein AVEN_201264-1 [Araneus ventricosus]|uniref:Uncharacterized protein n=1 Tax=Araneus ventricosus TaxID=182803 RepID=A0A4Y2SNS2_ARAVE|nr:hypothetical protein AVEN_77131-1 [Araneus ventricosus]GBN89827.1 hypothetical protein AVEN_228058-1 [Araneus ventricosus]GBN89835.1 hypothetical protein AVEN_201264-1 [Araneus ventricosus]